MNHPEARRTTIGTLLIAVTMSIAWLGGCAGKTHSGTTESDLRGFSPDNKIGITEAVKLADPYLDESYEMRIRDGSSLTRTGTSKTVLRATQDGPYYYIAKDDFTSQAPLKHNRYAVRVHAQTGEVRPPRPLATRRSTRHPRLLPVR